MKPAAPVTRMRARLDPPTLSLRPDSASDLGENALKRGWSQRKAGSARVSLSDPILPPSTTPDAGRRPKLLFLVTEDWYFCSHRLPVARAARAAGFEVVVATRVRAHGEEIREEGFTLRPIAWRRRGDGLRGAVRAILRNCGALPQRAAGHRPPCRAEAGAVRRHRPAARLCALGRCSGLGRFGHGSRLRLFGDDYRRKAAPATARPGAPSRGGREPGLDRSAEPGGPCRSNRDWGRHRANCADQGIGDRHQPFSAATRAWRRYHHRGTRLAHAAR